MTLVTDKCDKTWRNLACTILFLTLWQVGPVAAVDEPDGFYGHHDGRMPRSLQHSQALIGPR